MRNAIIGTWELDFQGMLYPVRTFLDFEQDGTFRSAGIREDPGREKSATTKGRWQLIDHTLTERITETSPPGGLGPITQDLVVSVDRSILVLSTRHGIRKLRRSQLPRRLPPALISKTVSIEELKSIRISTPFPNYPYKARRDHIEGSGLFRIVLNEAGRVRKVEILTSTGSDSLDHAAATTLLQWRFKAPPPWYEANVPITFALKHR